MLNAFARGLTLGIFVQLELQLCYHTSSFSTKLKELLPSAFSSQVVINWFSSGTRLHCPELRL